MKEVLELTNGSKLLEVLRNDLDNIDDEILELLVKRFGVIEQIGKLKKEYGIPIIQSERIIYIIEKAGVIAEKNNLNAKLLQNAYSGVISSSCDFQDQIINGQVYRQI